jgi:hypothetical protein
MLCGSAGTSPGVPTAVEVNVFVPRFTYTLDVTSLPELGRSGVLKYSYPGTVSCSV